MINNLKQKVLNGGLILKSEAMALANVESKQDLYDASTEITQKMTGNFFDTCSIVNARSGHCSENCKWCAQSSWFKTTVEEYDVVDENVCLNLAKRNAEYGIGRFSFVTSGRSLSDKNIDIICSYAEKIRSQVGIKLCASMGLLTSQQLLKLKQAGITRYHCNLESSDRFFPSLCSSHTIDDKIATLMSAKSVGMDVCSGGIIGMGESMEDRIDLALKLRSLEVFSIPINILNPIPGTPLENSKPLSDDEILTTISIFRFIHPKAFLRFAGGRTLIEHLEARAMKVGINSAIMGDMLTTQGTKILNDFKEIEKAGYERTI